MWSNKIALLKSLPSISPLRLLTSQPVHHTSHFMILNASLESSSEATIQASRFTTWPWDCTTKLLSQMTSILHWARVRLNRSERRWMEAEMILLLKTMASKIGKMPQSVPRIMKHSLATKKVVSNSYNMATRALADLSPEGAKRPRAINQSSARGAVL